MKKLIKFGEDVAGYDIPVLNEREIRAAAGLLFLLMFVAIQIVVFNGDFLVLKYAIIIFLADMLVRVLISPRFSPTLILGRMIVRKQTPEYVGARQKKFAWKIGIALAVIMFVLIVVMNTYSPITGLICLICLIFLFFESAFGICLGCKFYPLLFKHKVQYCPGEVCDMKTRDDIQKTSWTQFMIVIAFGFFIFLTIYLFNDVMLDQPYDLFGFDQPAQTN